MEKQLAVTRSRGTDFDKYGRIESHVIGNEVVGILQAEETSPNEKLTRIENLNHETDHLEVYF